MGVRGWNKLINLPIIGSPLVGHNAQTEAADEIPNKGDAPGESDSDGRYFLPSGKINRALNDTELAIR